MTTATKAQLEVSKLELEIKSLKRPFWQKPAFFASLTSLVLAATGLFMGFYTGFFDNQKLLLNIEKLKLEADVLKMREDLKDRVTRMEREVEIFLLRDINDLGSRAWLYENEYLSEMLYPEYFSKVKIPRKYIEEVKSYLAQVAWDRSYNLVDIEEGRLLPYRTEDGKFHSWVKLHHLLRGDPRWLRAHAMEVTHDRAKADIVHKDFMRLRERHHQHFIKTYVREFPPLKAKLTVLKVRYGEQYFTTDAP